jgi:hypothetical protein
MAGAKAANVVVFPNADISTTPYVISLDGGASTFRFSDINDAADPFIDAVSTGGNALVDSFVGFPAPFQQDILISDSDSFSAFVVPTGILFSNSLVSVGLEFQLLMAFTLVMRPYSDLSWFNMLPTKRRALQSLP